MIRKLRSSLTAKVFLLTALLLTLCCMATYGFIWWMVPQTYANQIDLESAEHFAYETSQELQMESRDHIPLRVEALLEISRAQFGSDLELHIFDESGYEVSQYDISQQMDKHISDYDAAKRTQNYSFSFADDTSEHTLFYADNAQAVNQAMEALSKVFPYLIALVLLIALLTAFIYSRYISAPIQKINRASQKMAALDFNVKCDTNRIDEVGGVSANLNALAEKLSITLGELASANAQLIKDIDHEKQMEKQRTELFSSVSHELKTPITIVKGQLQGMICGVGRYKDRDTYLLQSLGTMNSLEIMVQELLTISQMEAPDYACTREPFDLVSLLRHSLEAQEDLFIEKSMRLTCHLPESELYEGDPQLFKRVLDNLIVNALTYSPHGNDIVISLAQDDLGIQFSIENTGVHMTDADLQRVFEAFYRTEQSRNRQTGGSGLGLYIVKKVLDLHKVKYTMENTNRGMIFTITL
ncbi:MAG: HAMP domain-containing histidine kinase [Clostridiales bacterium]|nr:HAMP domain-containing histidine kinase [Clostridiales bacterium]